MSEVEKIAAHLTERDLRLIQSALNHAMDERESLADAYSYTGAVAKKAMAQKRAFEKLHRKLFNGPSARQVDIERIAAMPTVTLHELDRRAHLQPKDGQ